MRPYSKHTHRVFHLFDSFLFFTIIIHYKCLLSITFACAKAFSTYSTASSTPKWTEWLCHGMVWHLASWKTQSIDRYQTKIRSATKALRPTTDIYIHPWTQHIHTLKWNISWFPFAKASQVFNASNNNNATTKKWVYKRHRILVWWYGRIEAEALDVFSRNAIMEALHTNTHTPRQTHRNIQPKSFEHSPTTFVYYIRTVSCSLEGSKLLMCFDNWCACDLYQSLSWKV